MKPTEKFKDIVVNERTFRIKKFDAFTGSFILIRITALLAPIFSHLDLTKFKGISAIDNTDDISLDGINIPGIAAELGRLSEEDFRYLQNKSLQLCSEALPAGLIPIIGPSGTFAVGGLEDETMMIMALTIHALIFNVKGFFYGSPLASIVGGLLTTSPRD